MVIELGGSVFEITHDLVGDLFRAKNAGVTLGLSNWQKKLQNLSAQELRKKGMAWIPKGSIRTHDMGNDQAKGATQLKEKKRYERRSSKLRFAPNHQNYWSLPSSFTLQVPHMSMFWNSS
jgi:hypothetical protein